METHEPTNQPTNLTPEAFMELLDQADPKDCFPIIDGVVGTTDWETEIIVGDYHAPLEELMDSRTSYYHFGVSRGQIPTTTGNEPRAAETTTVTLRVTEGSKLSHLTADTSYSILRAMLVVGDTEIPVKVVRIKLPTTHFDYWLQREAKYLYS
jgi:hypothetical protein